MGKFTVQDGTGFPDAKAVYVMTPANGWQRVNRIHICSEIDTSDLQNPKSVWSEVEASYIPAPSDTVPNPVLENTDSCLEGTCTHTCSWDTVGSGDDNYSDDVLVEWYEDGVLMESSIVPQTDGQVQTERDVCTDRHCRVYYHNAGGSGPGTDTSTLFALC